MSQKTLLKAKGLYTDPNLLSSVPEGALVVADNVIIDRDNTIEPRRGNAQFGNAFGVGTDRAKQLLEYKDRILIHYDNKLLFNANPHDNGVDGDFQQFDGTYSELETGLRIKGIESNRNFYFTTDDGIKKISATTADDFTTAADFIVDAGAVKALDATGQLNSNVAGFLPANSKCSYRIVWGYKDANDNLILGAPSSRLVITNFSNVSVNVDLEFVIPPAVDTRYFYQVYRTAVFTATGNLSLDDIDPGDEHNLVVEDFPTAAQLTAQLVTLTDIAPEDFRSGGLPLYTNPNSGDGIDQSNDPPPKAKDITLYQNTVFYANTETRARVELALLSVQGMVSGVSSITIDDGINPSQTYTFVGEKEESRIDFSAYSGTIPTDLNGKYFLMNSASNTRKYYVWYDTTLTTQTLDMSGYIGTVPGELDGTYVVFYTPTRSYYLWFDSTGSVTDPGTDPNNTDLTGRIGIRVDTSGDVTLADVAASMDAALTTQQPIFDDYDNNYTALDEFVTIETEAFDDTSVNPIETIEKGFSYTINTPLNDDPANTPGVNTDVVGRIGFQVNVSRNVTTRADVADATAAAILSQDSASDFSVDYTTSNEFLDVTNTNNGNTDDIIDSAIEGVGNGISLTVTTQGDGEDAGSNHVLLSDAASPALQIDETARSLVNIINKNASESAQAFYISGVNDLPGQMLLEARDIGVNQFSITASDATVGALFNPSLPPAVGASTVEATPDIRPNRLYFSKLQQPEAVPILNFIDVGPQDQAISRVLALRESLFILKEDGVYRLTGLNGAFTVDLFDESTKIIAPDTAVVLNNQIFCLSNQGVVVISDTGVEIISKQLDNVFNVITSSAYSFRTSSFGVSYETDRSYWMWMPSSTTDTVATQAYRYNTFTQSWTRHPIAKTCGLVNEGDDKLYLGPDDENYIEQERKNFDRTDYADRDFDITIPNDSVEGTVITLSTSGLAEVGDALVQTQYLTIKQYNQLLKKLDLDPFTGEAEITNFDFAPYTGSIPGDLDGKYFLLYSASDATKYAVFYDGTGNLPSLDTTLLTDIQDATQIRVDVSGATTKADVANLTQNSIKSSTLDFIVAYTPGNEFFTTTTVQNGETTDAQDSTVNGISNSFAITVTQQGFGDYLSTLESVAGDNLQQKVIALAIKLDNDPSVVQTDYQAAVSDYSATGSTTAIGNPTVVTETGHQLQTGRVVEVTNSTTGIDGFYVVTRIDANTFSIPVETTAVGTLDWSANMNTFHGIQGGFNAIINKLNVDTGVLYSNYILSEGTTQLESLITAATITSANVTIEYSLDFIEGPIVLYKGITANVVYAPETYGDPSVMKQVREGTFMFENNTFTKATVGYKSDLSPGFDDIEFNKSGKGDWGSFVWGQQNWGGGFAGIPLRTYIPRSKQRCRFMQARFMHDSARERWAIFGLSYTLRGVSERAYRD